MATSNKSVVSKVVNAHEVEGLTTAGWRLDEVFQESYVESFSEQVPMIVPGQSYPTTYSGTKGFVVTKNLFLMKKDGSALVSEAHEVLEQAFAHEKTLQSQLAEVQDTARVLLGKFEVSETARIGLAKERDRARQDFEAERALALKMEGDIAKIRNAVGALKMKEILGQ